MSLTSNNLDVDRNIESPFALDGNLNTRKTYAIQTGMNSSILEHSIFEQMLKIESVSAVKIMQIANSQGIPTYQVTSNNISQVLPLLQMPSDVKTDIQNAVNAGRVVTVPKSEITYNNWTGTGYIILDPDTGAGAYMISGGLSGGETTEGGNWFSLKHFCEGFLAIVSVLEKGEVVDIAKYLGVFAGVTVILDIVISWGKIPFVDKIVMNILYSSY